MALGTAASESLRGYSSLRADQDDPQRTHPQLYEYRLSQRPCQISSLRCGFVVERSVLEHLSYLIVDRNAFVGQQEFGQSPNQRVNTVRTDVHIVSERTHLVLQQGHRTYVVHPTLLIHARNWFSTRLLASGSSNGLEGHILSATDRTDSVFNHVAAIVHLTNDLVGLPESVGTNRLRTPLMWRPAAR